jgi:hypothetical protein
LLLAYQLLRLSVLAVRVELLAVQLRLVVLVLSLAQFQPLVVARVLGLLITAHRVALAVVVAYLVVAQQTLAVKVFQDKATLVVIILFNLVLALLVVVVVLEQLV